MSLSPDFKVTTTQSCLMIGFVLGNAFYEGITIDYNGASLIKALSGSDHIITIMSTMFYESVSDSWGP